MEKPFLHISSRNKGECVDLTFTSSEGMEILDKAAIESILNAQLEGHHFNVELVPAQNSVIDRLALKPEHYSSYSTLIPREYASSISKAFRKFRKQYNVILDLGGARSSTL